MATDLLLAFLQFNWVLTVIQDEHKLLDPIGRIVINLRPILWWHVFFRSEHIDHRKRVLVIHTQEVDKGNRLLRQLMLLEPLRLVELLLDVREPWSVLLLCRVAVPPNQAEESLMDLLLGLRHVFCDVPLD